VIKGGSDHDLERRGKLDLTMNPKDFLKYYFARLAFHRQYITDIQTLAIPFSVGASF
jgi:hypothetical protein